jgi:hypothetical protein
MKVGSQPCTAAWKEVGFIGNADEFASLATARLDNLLGKTPILPNRRSHFSGGIRYKSERVDDTSMSEVADLMLSLTVLDS